MKIDLRLVLTVSGCLFSTALLGCVTAKEMGKGFIGASTQVLDQKRNDALKKSFALGYNDCYAKVKDILKPKNSLIPKDSLNLEDKEPYIYAEDFKNKMIAIYLSSTDTTVVGIFFTEETGANTLIEVSSPSTYAKEEIANRIFSGLASYSQSQKEKSIDDKEKTGNQ